MALDWTQIGAAVGAVGLVASGAYNWWQKQQRARADVRADVAESNTLAVAADAQGTVYKLMLDRVATLEADMRNVRAELSAERAHSRRQDNYIWQLIRLLRERGIEPPPFEDGEGNS